MTVCSAPEGIVRNHRRGDMPNLIDKNIEMASGMPVYRAADAGTRNSVIDFLIDGGVRVQRVAGEKHEASPTCIEGLKAVVGEVGTAVEAAPRLEVVVALPA